MSSSNEINFKKKLNKIGIGWVFLSVMCAISCSIGFYAPYWLNGEFINGTESNLGIFRRCNYFKLTEGELETVEDCGMYKTFSDIPSTWWKVSTLTVGCSTFLMATVAFVGLFALCIRDALSRTVIKLSGLFQAFSGECY